MIYSRHRVNTILWESKNSGANTDMPINRLFIEINILLVLILDKYYNIINSVGDP